MQDFVRKLHGSRMTLKQFGNILKRVGQFDIKKETRSSQLSIKHIHKHFAIQ